MTDVPLVELHLHLEGAAPPEFIRRLADQKKMSMEGVFAEDGSYLFRDFDQFLKVYEEATKVLTGPEEFYSLTEQVLTNCADHGVIYAEAFLTPSFCGGGDLGAWREYLAAIQEAAANMEAERGIILRGCVTCVRHEGPEAAKLASHCAAETVGDFITGYGMGGAELMGEPADFAYSFDMARESGLRITCHAGEWGGAEMVRKTLDDLGAERIGHGVMCVEDPALVERIAAEGIVLEVCPGSNVALGVVESWADHPIERLRAAGVKVTVSTDDPPFFHTTLSREYEMLNTTFGWDDEIIRDVNLTAARAAFCDEETRAKVIKRIEA